jgi:cytosine/uracil/thiamine/allantoin permease
MQINLYYGDIPDDVYMYSNDGVVCDMDNDMNLLKYLIRWPIYLYVLFRRWITLERFVTYFGPVIVVALMAFLVTMAVITHKKERLEREAKQSTVAQEVQRSVDCTCRHDK